MRSLLLYLCVSKSMHACFLFIERAQISPQKEIVNINQTMTAIIINFLLEYSHTSFVLVYPTESNTFLLEFRGFGYTFELCVWLHFQFFFARIFIVLSDQIVNTILTASVQIVDEVTLNSKYSINKVPLYESNEKTTSEHCALGGHCQFILIQNSNITVLRSVPHNN